MYRILELGKAFARRPYHWFYRISVRFACWWQDHVFPPATLAGSSTPPALLRFRVSGTPSFTKFHDVGQKTAECIEQAVSNTGRSMDDCHSILDFGCGCGRTLLWLLKKFPNNRFYGADVDQKSIDWCREHLPFAAFTVNNVLPPLPYPDGAFDLVYGISVFTHLSEDYQFRWLSELCRVAKTGGLVLLTVHGRESWKSLTANDVDTLNRGNHLFKRSLKLKGILPDWYHTAFHSPEYITRTFEKYCSIVAYIEQGLGYQDVVIVRKLDFQNRGV